MTGLRGGRGEGSGKRGTAWVIASFAACPCHLPVTLAALAVVLGGTAGGALLRDHIVLAGVVVTAVWAVGTARGLWLLRRPAACPLPSAGAVSGGSRSPGPSELPMQVTPPSAAPTGEPSPRVAALEDTPRS